MNTDRIEKRILLRAPRERVWRALADSTEFGSWFGMKVDGPFGPFTYRASDHQATAGAFVGRLTLKDGRGTMTGFKYVDGASVLPSDAEVKKLRPASAN